MLVWANLHASYIFGLALVGLFALEALIAEPDRRRVIVGWGGFGLAALLMACITPHGPAGLLFPFQVSQMAVLPLIQEWRPTRLPGDCDVRAVRLLGPGGDAAVLARIDGHAVAADRRPRLARFRACPSPGIVRDRVGAGPGFRAAAGDRPDQARRFDRASLSLLAIGLMVVAAVRLALPMQRADSPTDPATAISQVPEGLRKQPVLNTYSFGGPLIRNGIAPFIDGRADMYGDAFIFQHQKIVDGDGAAFEQAERRWGLKWTILAPKTRLVALLDRDPRWRRIYSDRWAVVHARI